MENTHDQFERAGEPQLPIDYFLVSSRYEEWYVSREMVQAIEAALAETPAPQWVMFVDLTGARIRVRTRLIEYVYQRTADQRALARAFHRARKAERKADPNWDEDD